MKKNSNLKLTTRGKVVVIIGLILTLTLITVFGRYVYNNIQKSYSSSKEFYFTSKLLSTNKPKYTFENWNGVESYEFAIDLFNNENDFLSVDYGDISYTLQCDLGSYSSKCTYSITGAVTENAGVYSGVIYQGSEKSTNVIRISPIVRNGVVQPVSYGDKVKFTIKATATAPYTKEISAEFEIKVGTKSIGYYVEDKENDICANLIISNTTEQNKNLVLSFDQSKLRIDMLSNAYQNKTTEQSSGGFINSITFPIEAFSSEIIRFYKVDTTQNYTVFTNEFRVTE